MSEQPSSCARQYSVLQLRHCRIVMNRQSSHVRPQPQQSLWMPIAYTKCQRNKMCVKCIALESAALKGHRIILSVLAKDS